MLIPVASFGPLTVIRGFCVSPTNSDVFFPVDDTQIRRVTRTGSFKSAPCPALSSPFDLAHPRRSTLSHRCFARGGVHWLHIRHGTQAHIADSSRFSAERCKLGFCVRLQDCAFDSTGLQLFVAEYGAGGKVVLIPDAYTATPNPGDYQVSQSVHQ